MFDCMNQWLSVQGTSSLICALKRDGYREMRDDLGNIYYVPEVGPIVYLRDANGARWYCDSAVPGESLEAYLSRRRPRYTEFVSAMVDAGRFVRQTPI